MTNVVVIRHSPSATDSLPGCGYGRDGFPSLRLGLLFLRQLPRMMRPKPQRALLGSPMSQLTRDISRVLNLIGPFKAARRFICTLRQFLQEPRSVLSVLSSPCLSVRVIHDTQHGENDVEKIRFQSGDFRNVVR